MTNTIDQIWADYEAQQARIKADYDAKMAAYDAHWAGLHTTASPPATIIDGWYPAAAYEADYKAGRLTD